MYDDEGSDGDPDADLCACAYWKTWVTCCKVISPTPVIEACSSANHTAAPGMTRSPFGPYREYGAVEEMAHLEKCLMRGLTRGCRPWSSCEGAAAVCRVVSSRRYAPFFLALPALPAAGSSGPMSISGASCALDELAGLTGRLMCCAVEDRDFSSSKGWDHWGPASPGPSGAKRRQTRLVSDCRLQCSGIPAPPADSSSLI